MQSSKLNSYLQVLASVGVLIGLLVVAYELRQNTAIAAAEHSRELHLAWIGVASFELRTTSLWSLSSQWNSRTI